MSKKKSLGHNPLTQSTLGYASYDFIAPSENNETEEDDTGKGKHSVNKSTASYYLEDPVINKIRMLAEKHDTSYSALVNKILKNTLSNISVD